MPQAIARNLARKLAFSILLIPALSLSQPTPHAATQASAHATIASTILPNTPHHKGCQRF